MKHLLVVGMALAVLCSVALPQDRYVAGPGKEVRLLPKGKSSLQVAREAGWTDKKEITVISGDGCPTSLETPGFHNAINGGVNFGFNDGDVVLMRLEAPVTGVIESVYFATLLVSTVDSSCAVRIFESAFTPSNPEPAGTQWIGYYDWPGDPNGVGNDPYSDTPGITGWVEGVPGGFDPNGAEIWGFGGFGTIWHSNTVNGIAMADLGVEPSVTQGDLFNVNIRFPSQFVSDLQRREGIGESDAIDPFDFMKYYYRGRLTGTDYGWWTREFNMAVWAVVRAEGNLPPIITSWTELEHTIDTGPQQVCVRAFDCNATNPADTGIASATLFYSVDGGSFTSVPMTGASPEWCANIPGMTGPALIEYYVYVTDNLGLSTEAIHRVYRVVNLNQTGYLTDYNAAINWIDISGTGTPLALSDFFGGDGMTQNADDGTAGPFDIGGDYNIFGGTGRYAWIGVNGALCLSTDPMDTIHVNSGGFFTSWEIPSVLMPPNFISAFWNDLVVDPAFGGQGTIYYQDLGTMFVVQFDGVGNFNDPNDTATFEIILDRTDPMGHKAYFQYLDVGTTGLELTAMSGLQEGPGGAWLLVNGSGYPVETQAADNSAIVLTNDDPTGVRPVSNEVPVEFALYANYPNPFNPSTSIKYSIPSSSHVTLDIFDALGRNVATLVDGEQSAGSYIATFDATNMANGTYFYRLKAGNFTDTKKMVLLK
jgi:hypothetical protein